MIQRPDWDTYYLNIAVAVSLRGDCVRAQHGAVIVKNNKIISTGYNGSPPGSDNSCGATGQCPRALDANAEHSKGDYDLCWSTHAEANAIIRASWEELQGSTIYITGAPCLGCMKLMKSSNIDRYVHIGDDQ
jgi:dCMP deaminase